MFRIVNSSEPSDHVDPRVCDSGSGNADVLPEQRSILEHDRLFIHGARVGMCMAAFITAYDAPGVLPNATSD